MILLGQAIVAYEIFTGKALPRHGFLRYWRRAIILAVGYGVVIGFSANTNLIKLLKIEEYEIIKSKSYPSTDAQDEKVEEAFRHLFRIETMKARSPAG